MTQQFRNRPFPHNRMRLLVGCGSAALALALTLAPQRAAAQAINAGGTVTDGVAFIDAPAIGQTTVDVLTPTAVIDWQPFEDVAGNALTFLSAGNTVTFSTGQLQDFAVLNRILPSTNGTIAVIDGTVLSRINQPSGVPVTGGFVAFYSPTGILIGNNASFDVGRLLLTTLDTSPASFANFAAGGSLNLAATPGSTARIQIDPVAQSAALAENSFFAVVAADVEMLGSAQVNGSHAYVAGEVVNLSFSNGLFDITVPVGTAATGEVVTLDGTVGGPSSTGIGDNHMIYGVAHAAADPISMLLRGNLGFDPAQSAGIVNGEIILASNYNVFGRTVDSGSISQGIAAVFRSASATSDLRTDITLEDFTATSSVLAISTGQTIAQGNSSVTGNLLLVGRGVAAIDAATGASFTVSGDVLVDARDYGVVSSTLQTLDAINASGGTARIRSDGATINIGGNALVTAEAFGGADDLSRIAGSAQGGLAQISVNDGSLSIAGTTGIRASAFGTSIGAIATGAEARGGTARLIASNAGQASIGQTLTMAADAIAVAGDVFNPSSVSNAYGGNAQLSVTGTGLARIDVGGSAVVSANAEAGSVNAASGGALADAGEAAVLVDGDNDAAFAAGLTLSARAAGGQNGGGQGGLARGGAARVVTTNGGRIEIAGDFRANAEAVGGDGQSGGDAEGGVAWVNAITGTIDLQQLAFAEATGVGGSATIGAGGSGGIGRGGSAIFQATGTLTQAATLTLGEDAFAFAEGIGGDGGLVGSFGVSAGRGGDGFGGDGATPNQADPAIGGGAYILAGGDNGNLTVTGQARAVATGCGGQGGFGGSTALGGVGGTGFGGLAQVGLALLGLDGSVGQGSASFSFLLAEADGYGGNGGLQLTDDPTGIGGNATGGAALVTGHAGAVTVDQVQLSASGFGGGGDDAGSAVGGSARVAGGQGGSVTANAISVFSGGTGGFSVTGRGGDGQGGTAGIEGDGIAITINGSVLIDAGSAGGVSDDGAGGNGTGGAAYIAVLNAATPGTITITGHAQVLATGQGGDSQTAFAAGNGAGGLAYIQAQAGSTVTLGSAQAVAAGRGGLAPLHEGGNGTGGTAELRSLGAGSRLMIQRNVSTDLIGAPGDGAILNADGIGAATNGGDGLGGSGSAGGIGVLARGGGSIALPTDPAADPVSVGAIRLLARGIGGESSVEGGRGGEAFGGSGLIEADGTGSRIIMGETRFTVFSEGGSSADSTRTITGGNAFGGNRWIRVLNGGEATLALSGGLTGGLGGDGSGSGDGGDVFGGRNQVDLDGGTLNIIGLLELVDASTGGTGNRGGDVTSNGEAGVVSFSASNSAINFTPDALGLAGIVLGGTSTGGDGTIAGGNAQGAFTSFSLINTNLSGGIVRIEPGAQGGNVTGLVGQGGSAVAGPVTVTITDSALNLVGETVISANPTGGDGGTDAGSIGGAAISGDVIASVTGSTLTLAAAGQSGPGILRLQSRARGGGGNAGGAATSAIMQLELVGSSLTADEIYLEASAFAIAGQGAAARGGDAELRISGASQLTADLIEIGADAVTSLQGFSQGGVAALVVEPGSAATIAVGDLGLFADAVGAADGRQANGAGQFLVTVAAGNLNTQNLTASATGDVINTSQPAAALIADGGSINVAGALDANLFGDLLIQTGQGGIIGGAPNAALTTAITLAAQGGIAISGDNGGVIGLGGDTVRLAARNLDIQAGARIGARAVAIESHNTGFTAVLGGTAEAAGFTLTAAEMGRINADEFALFVPAVGNPSDPNLADLLIRDLTLTGSQNGGFSSVRIIANAEASGVIRVEGTLALNGAGIDDLLLIEAAERLEVITPGGIRLTDNANAPGGRLALLGQQVWAADPAALGQLRTNPDFAGRDALFAGAAQGSADPLGYLRARAVTIGVGQRLLVRNTGAPFANGGILVGAGGLSISLESRFGAGTALDVFAYGRRLRDDGTVVIGQDFFNEVNFNRAGNSPTTYLAASRFNDCIINTGECPQAPPPPPPPPPSVEEAPPQLNNPVLFEPPLTIGNAPLAVAGDQDDRFGIDFPERPETPLITEDPLLDDPVTSGGDPSVYGTAPTQPAGGK